jgi:hypothetical protein
MHKAMFIRNKLFFGVILNISIHFPLKIVVYFDR